jgi:hypothetical protein
MPTFTVRLYADGSGPMRTEELSAPDVTHARQWATDTVMGSQTFSRARIYDGETLLSEIGYRINP